MKENIIVKGRIFGSRGRKVMKEVEEGMEGEEREEGEGGSEEK